MIPMKNGYDGFRGEYAFLSNMYCCQIEYDGCKFPSAEHMFQAYKFKKFMKPEAFRTFCKGLLKMSPSQIKNYAKKCAPVKSGEWDTIRVDVMRLCIRCKFDQNIALRNKLMLIGDTELIEYNYWGDTFWGKALQKNGDFVGENMLGRLLMEYRDQLPR